MVDGLLPSLPLIESGRFRALGITSAARSPAAPQVPTIAETLPGYQADIWYGLLGPAGTPREVVVRLNAVANKALAGAEIRARLAKLGATVAGGPPEAFAKHIAREIPKWAKVVKATGARIHRTGESFAGTASGALLPLSCLVAHSSALPSRSWIDFNLRQ